MSAATLLLRDHSPAFRLAFLTSQVPWMSYCLAIGSIPGALESSMMISSIVIALYRFHLRLWMETARAAP